MDWQKVVLEIKESGLRHIDIGLYCEVPASTIHRIGNGKIHEPRANLGLKLMQLHKKVMKSNKERQNAT